MTTASTGAVGRAGFQLSLRGNIECPPPGTSLKVLYSLLLATWQDGFPHAAWIAFSPGACTMPEGTAKQVLEQLGISANAIRQDIKLEQETAIQ